MFTAEQMRAAVSPETALVIMDYPHGRTLRCKKRLWIEYRKGKGFRVVYQTTNPKKAYDLWQAPKASTYSRVSMGFYIEPGTGHVHTTALSEYSDLSEYAKFKELVYAPGNLSEDAERSFYFYSEVKKAYEEKRAELGVVNIFDATTTQEQKNAIRNAWAEKMRELMEQGYDY